MHSSGSHFAFHHRGRNTGTLAEGKPWHALARSLITELQTITVYSYFAPRSEFCKNKIFVVVVAVVAGFF